MSSGDIYYMYPLFSNSLLTCIWFYSWYDKKRTYVRDGSYIYHRGQERNQLLPERMGGGDLML